MSPGGLPPGMTEADLGVRSEPVGVALAVRSPAPQPPSDRGAPDAIDYVIAHELCHMAEPHHGAAFHALLGRVMPDWEERKRRLEVAMA